MMNKQEKKLQKDQGIIVDLGTGDGKLTYELAKQHPDRLVIGVDPSHQSLEKVSLKINKRSAKGGLLNAMFVIARVEDLPQELDSVVNQVFIILPWAGLLEGLVLAKPETLEPIKRICQDESLIEIVLGYHQPSEGNRVNLPELNKDFLENSLAPQFEKQGFFLQKMEVITKDQLDQLPTTWAKKLKFGKKRNFFYLQFQIKKL